MTARSPLILCLGLIALASACAQPEGWQLQFSDDFEREAPGEDWIGAVMAIEDGALLLGREDDMGSNFVATTRGFAGAQRLEFEAWAPTDRPCDLTAVLNCGENRYSSGYLFGFGSRMNTLGQLILKTEAVKQFDLSIIPHRRYKIVCQREGNRFVHTIDGEVVLDYTHPEALPGPLYDRIGLYSWHVAKIDNVRLYTKAENVQIAAVSDGGSAGQFAVKARGYPDPGKIVVSVDLPQMDGPQDVSLQVALLRGGREVRKAILVTAPAMREEVVLEAEDLPAGEYRARAEVMAREVDMTQTAEVSWPGRSPEFRDITVLNNLVWELVSTTWINPEGLYRFHLPCDRWVFVRTRIRDGDTGRLTVTIDPGRGVEPLYVHQGPGETQEAMRFLRAGDHSVQVEVQDAEMRLLQVRAVPEIQHSRYPTTVAIDQGLRYDWDFLSRHILPHVNTIISSGMPDSAEAHAEQWRAGGGKWISYGGRPGLQNNKEAELSAQTVADFFRRRPGYAHRLCDGQLVDEFYHKEDPAYPAYAGGIALLNQRFPGKAFYPYAAGSFGKDEGSIPFAGACIAGGGYICWEAYLAEWATQNQALDAMRRYPERNILPLEDKLPGATRHTIWVFGAFSYPWPYADGYASVNYNAYLDMQFQMLATHPALFGLGGVHIWRSGYCDEERVRWFGRMFRHYCIEGATDRLSDDPYELGHISNPDFSEGEEGWTLQPAAEGAITAEDATQFGKFIGRYYRGPDSFLVTRRQAGRANVFSQRITGLEPGRTYSVKLLTGDYADFTSGVSRRQVHPVIVTVGGAELLQGKPYSYQEPFPTRGRQGQFTDKNPFFLNYHWQVFRATGETAELRISDEPAAEGQQMLYTFVEVKPFLMD